MSRLGSEGVEAFTTIVSIVSHRLGTGNLVHERRAAEPV